MPNPSANARFLLELAEKGRSLHPHIPKQYSDRIGLVWAICRECNRPLLFSCELESVPKRGELTIAKSGTGIYWFSIRQLKQEKPSGLARLRLLYYFAPILSEDKFKTFSDLLLRG